MCPVLTHYDDGNILEDTQLTVTNVSPKDTPFVSGLRKNRATAVIHQWPEDTLKTRGDNAVTEGAAFSFGTITQPARIVNITQVIDRAYFVSSTETWIKTAGSNNPEYQKAKALMELANDMEHAYIRGSRATGSGSGARRMQGALNFITTTATAVGSGTQLTESFYNGINENVYLQGGKIDEVYVGARMKRAISGFTAGSTKFIMSKDKRLTLATDVYESDFGIQRIFLNRDMLTGDNSNALMLIESGKLRMSIGESAKVLSPSEVAQDSHGVKGVVRYEGTMEITERHCAKATGFSNAF